MGVHWGCLTPFWTRNILFSFWFLRKLISCHLALNCPKRTPPVRLPPPSPVMSFPAPRLVHGMFNCNKQKWKQNSIWQKIYEQLNCLILPAESVFWFQVLSAMINCSCAYHSVGVVSHRFVDARQFQASSGREECVLHHKSMVILNKNNEKGVYCSFSSQNCAGVPQIFYLLCKKSCGRTRVHARQRLPTTLVFLEKTNKHLKIAVIPWMYTAEFFTYCCHSLNALLC